MTIAPDLAPDVVVRGVLWQAAHGCFLLDVPGVARYQVSDGRAITIEPAPDAAFSEVTRFLGMAPLAALCYQRGALAFHAAACAPPLSNRQPGSETQAGGAVLLAGDSGVGKSTLLAALAQRGWRPLADDLAIVDLDARGRPVVLPNPSPIRLWPDAQAALGWTEELTARPAPADEAQPLRAIYWLTVHNRDAVEASELTGAARFRAIGYLAYNTHIADALLDRAVFLRKAGAIAQAAPLRRLNRPRGKWCIDALVEEVAAGVS